MPPHYPIAWGRVARLAQAVLFRQRRSFRADASAFMNRLQPAPRVDGAEYIPAEGPCLLTVNHYYRPGFGAWWLTLAIASLLPVEIHWIMAAAWTFTDPDGQKHPHRARLFTPPTSWLFHRIAETYGFTAMPPMPPSPNGVERRARAVRQALEYARRTARPIIGLAPEGGDAPGGVLRWPPPGVGRFVMRLSQFCQDIIPIGVYEDGDRLCVQFGGPYRLPALPGLTADQRDRRASELMMRRIALQLPPRWRGEFG